MTELLCDFTAGMTCPRCGYQAKSLPTFRHCRPVPPKPWRPFMLGDFVERCLTRVGITKARVERWTRTEGQPGGCGCTARKRWLNDWGVALQKRIRRLAKQYRRFVLP
jgi:hypothetical protein